MKILKKYFYLFFISATLLCIAAYGISKTDISLPVFLIENPNEQALQKLSMFDAKDGNYYVFLPSYADTDYVSILIPSKQKVSLNDVELSDGMNCGDFSLETPYSLKINKKQIATLYFYKSENVGTMYIETATGSMEHIHKDKSYEESASVSLYTADGTLNFADDNSILKGRGNATWNYDKRPYSLTLSNNGNLLGMGESSNWILLANATDETNLNNKLVSEIASQVGIQWSPECQWIDLYLNGEYNGLYLLTERIEVSETRLNIDNSIDFLCKVDLNERWETLRNPILTNAGRAVEISYPETLTELKTKELSASIDKMEQTLLSNTDLQKSDIIDLDSWVRRYLIDEISGNIDSDLASSYFYLSDGVFYAGPIWDYDKTFGNDNRNQEPCAFIAKNAQKSDSLVSPYYNALYTNKSFYNRMVEIYANEFVPVLQQMLNGEIKKFATSISKASQMNSIRWRSMYDEVHNWSPGAVCSTTDLLTYFEKRVSFLNRAWLKNTDYCTVQFEFFDGGAYWNISVEKNTCLKTTYIDFGSTIWLNSETGEAIDFNKPITSDIIVTKQIENTQASKMSLTKSDYIVFLSIGAFILFFLIFSIVDFSNRFKERRFANEPKQKNISS